VPGKVSGAAGTLLCNGLFNFVSSFIKVSRLQGFEVSKTLNVLKLEIA
jgi:pyrrolidone-carboxylate peptidase